MPGAPTQGHVSPPTHPQVCSRRTVRFGSEFHGNTDGMRSSFARGRTGSLVYLFSNVVAFTDATYGHESHARTHAHAHARTHAARPLHAHTHTHTHTHRHTRTLPAQHAPHPPVSMYQCDTLPAAPGCAFGRGTCTRPKTWLRPPQRRAAATRVRSAVRVPRHAAPRSKPATISIRDAPPGCAFMNDVTSYTPACAHARSRGCVCHDAIATAPLQPHPRAHLERHPDAPPMIGLHLRQRDDIALQHACVSGRERERRRRHGGSRRRRLGCGRALYGRWRRVRPRSGREGERCRRHAKCHNTRATPRPGHDSREAGRAPQNIQRAR